MSKTGITLGLHSDGKYYIFVDGAPIGTGFELSGNNGDVFGYVDENNNIVLNGSLADGSYNIKFEREDGTTVDIGDLVLDTNVYYSIHNDLTNCTTNNSATQIVAGQAYSATITANSGYELKSVTVTMGGNAVSVSGENINIAKVTGNIVITAVAEEKQAAEPVTVNIPLTDGIRLGSDGGERVQAGYCTTQNIDLTNIPKPCTLNLTKARWCSDGSGTMIRVHATKADGNKLINDATKVGAGGSYFTVTDNNDNGSNVTVIVNSADVGFIRFSGCWTIEGYSDSSDNFNLANTKVTLTYTPGT